MLQISIAQRQMKAKIHSFPTMYILGGVDVVEMGQIKVFVQKLGLKQGFLADTNMDYLTSDKQTKTTPFSESPGRQLSDGMRWIPFLFFFFFDGCSVKK